MIVTDQRKSLENCTESGWDAYDLITRDPITDEDICSLRCMEGSFVYLKQLRKPFFKIESHNYVIKGVKGDSFFRFAVHRDHLDYVEYLTERFAPPES